MQVFIFCSRYNFFFIDSFILIYIFVFFFLDHRYSYRMIVSCKCTNKTKNKKFFLPLHNNKARYER